MYTGVPMLRFMTLTRIVRRLWSENDVETSMAEYFLDGDKTLEKWSSIQKGVELKVENYDVPQVLKIILLSLVEPIGSRIKNIIMKIYGNDYLPSRFTSILKWTLLGTIDAKKTAEGAIKDENLSITKRYEVACTYCLEEEILMLWSELSETSKDYYSSETRRIDVLIYLPIYWSYSMKMDMDTLESKIQEKYRISETCYSFGIMYAFINGNQPAIEYFIGNLNMADKERYFVRFYHTLKIIESLKCFRTNEIYLCDIIYCWLSQMNENQRTSLFERFAYFILKHFLEFPYLGLFLETESNVQKYLSDDQKVALLNHSKYKETSNYFIFRTFKRN